MIARTAFAFVFALLIVPDEGQWLPTQVRSWDWEALQRRGMELSKDQFWHPDKGGVLSATVQINGCTASFVSADGLMVTNHHCGFGAVSALSTVENNWLRDGFSAPGRTEELPAAGMSAFVLKRIEDVTDKVHAAQEEATTDLERWQLTQQIISKLVREGQATEPDTVCSVASYLEGKEYHLSFRTRITDVRLVYAPPRAIGEFGGDVDNWEWPRHTGDFTFFRAYTGPDGKPRPHAADNVPYRPQHYLKISATGAHEGDLAIIMGYPGRTERYKTSRAVVTRQGFVYPKRQELLESVIRVLEAASSTSEAKALEMASRIKSLANVEKNARGMVFGLARNAVAERKRHEESQLRDWLVASPEREQRWGKVLDDLLALDEDEAQNVDRNTAVGFGLYLMRDVPLVSGLIDACGAVASQRNGVSPRMAEHLASDELAVDLELVQLPIFGILLDEFRSMRPDRRLRGTEELPALDDGPTGLQLARQLIEQSKMTDASARRDLFAEGADAVANSTDALIVFCRGLAEERADYIRSTRERDGRMLVAGRRWIEAQEAFRGQSFYPDANSTLRVSIAEVKGYQPRDGVYYTPHTTVAGLIQKETGKDPFANPTALLHAAEHRHDSRFADKSLGDVPVCFLTNGDTTGGNSGSPVINGKGELIGLNFDRVFENVAGDFGWNEDRSRNVSCDLRYVLWVVESVLPAPALLAELGF